MDEIRGIAERVARSHHLDVFDVQHRREGRGWVVRVFLDRATREAMPTDVEEGVTVEDCERVSRDLSAVLDVEDIIDHAYTLEVSSPGLDRPLRTLAEYRRFVGRMAKIVVATPVDNQLHFEGRLAGVEEDVVLLEAHGRRLHRIPLGAIRRARLAVEF